MKTIRAFLAIPLPVALQQDIARLQTELFRALPGVRRTAPETVHLTLRFFGDIPSDELEKIHASMLSVSLRARAFEVDVCGLGAFPSRNRPRVVWLGLTPADPLSTLHRACQQELAKTGLAEETRGFAPHLTIGRFREGGPDLTALLASQERRVVGTLPIGELVLFESRLLPDGARHIPLFTVPLRRDDQLHY